MQSYYMENPEPMEGCGNNTTTFSGAASFSKYTRWKYQNKAINLMDTPGYILAIFGILLT